MPPYVIRTMNSEPPGITAAGSMISSFSARVKIAGSPFTRTSLTFGPTKSKLNAARFAVTFTRIVATPVRVFAPGSMIRSRS